MGFYFFIIFFPIKSLIREPIPIGIYVLFFDHGIWYKASRIGACTYKYVYMCHIRDNLKKKKRYLPTYLPVLLYQEGTGRDLYSYLLNYGGTYYGRNFARGYFRGIRDDMPSSFDGC